ncbi:hypothetical protein [Parendozoicomonas sp. Alg238-R29]|uniref:protein kinase domain-containing protein n=1 Tax=Parendozoicomonas sp. Alg238-R29 TaxID=2993446 RepID=UPI00248EDEC8|nr:hypothetical protein [Parendozoicomonas sp. Alg238-R29]
MNYQPRIPGMDFTGRVYGRFARETKDTVTGKLCIVKGPFLPCADENRFQREADILQQLPLQGVAGLRQCFRERRRCWLVFDRIPGATISDCGFGNLFPERAGWLIAKLSRILSMCHQRGWAHCDICPANVQLHGSKVWLLDFGASLALGKRYPWQRQVRPAWSSPSLLEGKGRVSPTDDVYSLLLLSGLLLTGQQPFPGPSRTDFSRWSRRLDRPGRLSRRQWHFLQRSLEHPNNLTAQDLAVQALGW